MKCLPWITWGSHQKKGLLQLTKQLFLDLACDLGGQSFNIAFLGLLGDPNRRRKATADKAAFLRSNL
ncbi:hypothetical protein J6590_031456 [Homalodisca vitripennis]|nr:hypothetical protein J6590_031456 [Homalodisca vitripennis]